MRLTSIIYKTKCFNLNRSILNLVLGDVNIIPAGEAVRGGDIRFTIGRTNHLRVQGFTC